MKTGTTTLTAQTVAEFDRIRASITPATRSELLALSVKVNDRRRLDPTDMADKILAVIHCECERMRLGTAFDYEAACHLANQLHSASGRLVECANG